MNEAWTYFSFSTLLSQHPETIERRESRVRRTPERRFKLSEHHFSIFYSVSFFIFIFFFLEFFFYPLKTDSIAETLFNHDAKSSNYLRITNYSKFRNIPRDLDVFARFRTIREFSTCPKNFEIFLEISKYSRDLDVFARFRTIREFSTCPKNFEIFHEISKYSTCSQDLEIFVTFRTILSCVRKISKYSQKILKRGLDVIARSIEATGRILNGLVLP